MIGLVIVTHGRLAHEFSAALMSTKSRQTIYGGPIMGARIRADGARKRAAEAVRQARWTLEFECVPEGFMIVMGQYGPNFYCARCDVAAKPWRGQSANGT